MYYHLSFVDTHIPEENSQHIPYTREKLDFKNWYLILPMRMLVEIYK